MIRMGGGLFPLALVFCELVIYMTIDMYLPGLTAIGEELMITQDQVQYTFVTWFLGACIWPIFLGPIADRYGRKMLLILSNNIFIIATLLCAISDNYYYFLVLRFIQGSNAAVIVVVGYAILHELYNSRKATRIISIMSSIVIISPGVGPVLGALLLDNGYTWRDIFYLLTILGILSTLLLIKTTPSCIVEVKNINISDIIRSYKKLIYNRYFLAFSFMSSLAMSINIIWIIESPFIIIITHKMSLINYSIIQFIVFSSPFIAMQLLNYLLKGSTSCKNIFKFGMMLSILGASIPLLSNIISIIYAYTAATFIVFFGLSFIYGLSQRLVIDSCPDESMCNRTSVFQFLMAISYTLASCIITCINNKTFFNLYIMIDILLLLCVILYFLAKDRMLLPNNNDI